MNPSELRILLDGWPLIYRPLSPSAFHLIEIYEALMGERNVVLALPAKKPSWLSEKVQVVELPRSPAAIHHLRWVQSDLPRIAHRLQAAVIHVTQAAAPLFTSQSVLYSPTEATGAKEGRRMTFWEKIDLSFSFGGVSRAIAVNREDIFKKVESLTSDLQDEQDHPLQSENILLSESSSALEIPYFLYQSNGDWQQLSWFLQVWSRTTAHLGDQARLAIVCWDRVEHERITEHSSEEFLQTLHLFVDATPPFLIALLKEAIALIQLEAEAAWGGMARRALSLGVPVLGFELDSIGESVGAGGYLVPEGDARGLSAAMITVVVEEEVLMALRENARLQAAAWNRAAYRKGLLRFYREAVQRKSTRVGG